MKKKILVTILSLIMALSFTACGSSDNSKIDEKQKEAFETSEDTTVGDNESKTEDEDSSDSKKPEAKTESKDKTSSSSSSSSSSDTKKPTSSSSSSSSDTKEPTSSSSSSSSDTKKPSSNTTSKPSSGSNGNSSGSSSSNTESKPSTEVEKERTVTVKYPVYGPMYTCYWIKDDNGKVIYETKDAKAWDNKCLECWDKGMSITYGQDGKNDIVGYESYTYTESEYNDRLANSNLGSRTDVIITWN